MVASEELHSPIRVASALLALALAARADVLVVDVAGGGGAHHTQIHAAVGAAQSGDVLLVRAGVYEPFGIHGKAITVVADEGANVRVAGEMVVRFTPVGQAVKLRGLRSELGLQRDLRGLVLGANAGAVLVEDCVLAGSAAAVEWIPGFGYEFHEARPALRAAGNANVVLVRCVLDGGRGNDSQDEDTDPFALRGAPAAHVTDGALHVYDSLLLGGDGGSQLDTVIWNGEPGGSGLVLEEGFLYATATVFGGGDGGRADQDHFTGQCGDGGDGGHGLALVAGASAKHSACSFLPGQGGAAGGATCWPGAAGSPITPAAAATDLLEPARRFTAQTPVRSGQSMALTISGPPGEFVWILVGPLAPEWQAPFLGSRLALPTRIAGLGTIPASGTMQANIPVPALHPNYEGLALMLQTMHQTPNRSRRWGGGSSWVWLQPHF